MIKDSQSEDQTLSVLKTVYSHQLDKQEFGDLLHALDDAILNLTRSEFDTNDIPARLKSLENLEQHFELATRIDLELSNEDEEREISRLIEGSTSCFSINEDLRILQISTSGIGRLGDISNQLIENLPIRNQDIQMLRSVVRDMITSQETCQKDRALFVRYHKDDEFAIFHTTHFRKSKIVVVSFDHLVWTTFVEDAVKRNFEFTKAECKVVRLMVEGKRPAEIAIQLERSVETIRSHVKAAISKTYTRDTSALIRLMCEVMKISSSLDFAEKAHGDLTYVAPSAVRFVFSDQAYDATSMVGIRNPDPNKTALFIHGMLQGPFVTTRLRKLLSASEIELICPSRPGYGGTPAAKNKHEFVEASLDHMLHLLDAFGIEQANIVAHMVGMHFATRLAARAPDRVRSITSISGVIPMMSKTQLRLQSKMHRMAMLAAKYSPATLGYIAQIGERYLRNGNELKCLNQLFSRSTKDQAALKIPEYQAILKHGFKHLTAAGSSAFIHDCQSGIEDWSQGFSQISCPVQFLHGNQDSAVPSESLDEIMPQFPEWDFDFYDDAGQTLLHTHADAVGEKLKVIFAA